MRGTSPFRFLVLSAVSVVGLSGIGVPAALAAPQNRIVSNITEGSSSPIPSSVHPRVAAAIDLGPSPANTRLQMSLRFTMSAEQQAALDQLLVDLQNPASPRYHQWLTPTQYAAQFGLSSADLAKVTAWLTGQGFTVTGVANSGLFVTFDGTVAQAQSAFSTSIHNLSVNGEPHFANVTNASVPSALASVVGAITGLHNFRMKPHLQASVVKPQFTSSVSGSHYLAPGDIYTIYDVNPLLTAGINGAGVGTGSNCHSVPAGTTCGDIAVMGQVDISTADVSAFRSASGLSITNLPVTVHEGADPGSPTCTTNACSPNDGDLAESSIDVEWSGAMAPSANLLFVNGTDVLANSMTQAIDQNLAPIITLSYGNCEAAWGSTEMNMYNQLFKQANAQGQTILAAAGDVGATDCDAGTTAIEGLTVDFPSASPYVTSLGGTQFSTTSTSWNTNSSSTTANAGSATAYIPESVWNEDSAGNGFSSGGGGVSSFFSKPAWQVETGAGGMTTQVAPDASRDVPDLALDAAAGGSDIPYLYCAQGFCTSGFRNSTSNLDVAGGTSFDSQIFGGMLALVEQKIGSRIGNANQTIYALGNNSAFYNTTSLSVFHDVTSGNNSNPCTAGTPNCTNCPICTEGYSAGTGYDLATGWGSVDLNNLATDWKLVTPLGLGSNGTAISATALTASTIAPPVGTAVTLTATVTGGSGTPTGAVQFLVNNVAAPGASSVALSGGVASYTFVTSCANLGQQMMSAVYSGDGTYAGSKGPVASGFATQTSNGTFVTTPLVVTVSAGTTCPDFSLSPSSTVPVAAGATIPAVTITATPANGFTGKVVFTASVATSTGITPGVTLSPTSATITSGAVTTSLTLTGITAELQRPAMPGHSRMPWYAGSGVTIASLLLLTLPRRRRLGGLLMVALAVALIGAASGCSSNQAAPPAVNPDIGTYIVTVTGTFTSTTNQVTSHSTTVTYNVN